MTGQSAKNRGGGRPVIESLAMDGRSGEPPSPRTAFTVVLWHVPDERPPAPLVRHLEARSIRINRVTSPFMALAHLCQLTPRNRTQRGQVAVIFVHPERLPDAAAVFEAAARYAPGARCWMYGPASNPRLRAVVEADVEAWSGEPTIAMPQVVVRPPVAHRAAANAGAPSGYRARPAPQPPLRLTPGERVDAGFQPADVEESELAGHAEPARPSQLLTPEELAMLLGEDEPERP